MPALEGSDAVVLTSIPDVEIILFFSFSCVSH